MSADEYAPFEANRNFFYLTGIRRENMMLILDNATEEPTETLLIEEADPDRERWMGKKMTVDEAKAQAQIEKVGFIDTEKGIINRMLTREDVYTVYFDTYRHDIDDLEDYNMMKAREFAQKYPGVRVKDCAPIIAEMRMQKDEDEVSLIREAIKLTDGGLKNLMSHLQPGQMEYQAQADFEYSIKRNGADGVAFHTIAGSGINGTMLHYVTNECECKDNTLLLLDLGAKYKGYCADITRTYPVNGKFTEKHRGKGTFVSTPSRSVDLKEQSGFTNYLSAIGHKSHHLLLKKELQPSDDFLCETLSLQPNEPVCYVQRLIFEDDSPLALDEIYISSLTYPDFLDRITGDISFYELLTNYYNVSRGESVCEIAVRIANAEQASILHCQAGDPLFLLQKTCFAVDGTPIHYSRSLVRGDRISYTIRTQNLNTQFISNINN